MNRYRAGTALLVVDMQNDFIDPRGSLYVRDGEVILPFVNREIQAALSAMVPIVYTQDWHPAVTPHFRKDGGIWPVHCVKETWGAELHQTLLVEGPIVRKGAAGEDGYSGFSERDPRSGDVSTTSLGQILVKAATEWAVIMGVATDYCVVETALDARNLGFSVTVLREGIRAVDREPGDGERAIARMREAGVNVF